MAGPSRHSQGGRRQPLFLILSAPRDAGPLPSLLPAAAGQPAQRLASHQVPALSMVGNGSSFPCKCQRPPGTQEVPITPQPASGPSSYTLSLQHLEHTGMLPPEDPALPSSWNGLPQPLTPYHLQLPWDLPVFIKLVPTSLPDAVHWPLAFPFSLVLPPPALFSATRPLTSVSPARV